MKQTKKQKFEDIHAAFKCIQQGEPVRRTGAKDGSIPTHPAVECPDLSEHEVQERCIAWLKRHQVYGNRLNVGSGVLVSTDAAGFTSTSGTFRRYGITGAGDWIGLLPNGLHVELEFKKGRGGRLSRVQQERQEAITKNNGLYFVIHGVEELEYYLSPLIAAIDDGKDIFDE